MAFSSNIFIFYFFPISVILVLIAHRVSNLAYKITLLFLNYIFCFWLGKETLLYILVISVVCFVFQFIRNKKILYIYIVFIVIYLLFYKYFPLLYSGENYYLLKIISLKPVAISFVSLSAISFCIDSSKTSENYSFIDASLYITYFPKYISGPVVRWRDFCHSLDNITISLDNAADGIIEFIKGLALKIVIADTLNNTIYQIISSYSKNNSVLLVLSIFTYAFVIYFDFLGYSKMAKGISETVGIELPKNFDKPYRSKSISEFYRKWHISLGNFFKEYIYIPLGGGKKNVLLNIFIVMLISGMWHGEGFAYILWGITNGIIMMIERKYPFKRSKAFIAVNYIIVSILWMPFMLDSLKDIYLYIICILTNTSITGAYGTEYFFNIRTLIVLLAAIILSFGDLSIFERKMKLKLPALYYLGYIVIFIISVVFMINSKYSPFIYFRF